MTKLAIGALRDLRVDHNAVQRDVSEIKLLLEGQFLRKAEADRTFAMIALEDKALELRIRTLELSVLARRAADPL